MKSYDEITASVKRKAAQRLEEKKRRRAIVFRSTLGTIFCAAAILGVIAFSDDIMNSAPDREGLEYRQETVSTETTAADYTWFDEEETDPPSLPDEEPVQTTAPVQESTSESTAAFKRTLPPRHTEEPRGEDTHTAAVTTAMGSEASPGRRTTAAKTTSAASGKTAPSKTTAVTARRTTVTTRRTTVTTRQTTVTVRPTTVTTRQTTAIPTRTRTTVTSTGTVPFHTHVPPVVQVTTSAVMTRATTTFVLPRTESPWGKVTTRPDTIQDYDPDNDYVLESGGMYFTLTHTTVSGYDAGGISPGAGEGTMSVFYRSSGARLGEFTADYGVSGGFSGDFCRFCTFSGSGADDYYPLWNKQYHPDTLSQFLSGIGFEEYWSLNCTRPALAKNGLLSLEDIEDPGASRGNITDYAVMNCPVLGINGIKLSISDTGYLLFEFIESKHYYYIGTEQARSITAFFTDA